MGTSTSAIPHLAIISVFNRDNWHRLPEQGIMTGRTASSERVKHGRTEVILTNNRCTLPAAFAYLVIITIRRNYPSLPPSINSVISKLNEWAKRGLSALFPDYDLSQISRRGGRRTCQKISHLKLSKASPLVGIYIILL